MAILVPVLFATVVSAAPWEPAEPAMGAVDERDGESGADDAAEVAATVRSASSTTTDSSPVIVEPEAPPAGDDAVDADDGDAGGEGEEPADGGPAEPSNHGQVVRDSHGLTDGVRGCVNRQIAQSDLGKKHADGDGDGPVLLEDGTVDPDSIDLECVNGRKDDRTAEEQGSDTSDPTDDADSDKTKPHSKSDETSRGGGSEKPKDKGEPPAKGKDKKANGGESSP